MAYTPVEKLIDKADYSIFRLVALASKRATELAEGAKPLIATDGQLKPTTVALLEIIDGKIRSKK